MKTRKQVLQWLKDNEIYDKVKRKIAIPVERHPMNDNDLHEFFVSAFDWRYTSEGADYWKSVNKKYLDWYGSTKSEKSDFNTRINWTK